MRAVLIVLATTAGLMAVAMIALFARGYGRALAAKHNLARRLTAANAALGRIEAAADDWRDIDSVLATQIRAILRAHRDGRPLNPPPPPKEVR